MEKIAIIGGGLMGVGIAQVFAAAGHPVAVYEPNPAIRAGIAAKAADAIALAGGDPAGGSRISAPATMAEAVAQAAYITEAAPERLEVKRAIFAELEVLASPAAILASNTSVIQIARISDGLATAGRVIGTHWWNPPYLVPLVEVVQSATTSDATVAATMALLRRVGKQPAHVRKDVPGFVANRLQHALWREAIAMVSDGICDAATLDACVKSSFGLRLAVLGPLENADMVGLDLTLDIHRTIMPELDRHDRPHEFLAALVAAGKLGFKSGEGFRAWTEPEMQDLRALLVAHLSKQGQAGAAPLDSKLGA